jgi:sigma-E factor negative regulatory protein RseC
MENKELISHTGRINQITTNRIFVTIVSESACAACHAKGFCGVSDMKEKVIEIKNPGNFEHKIGECVTIVMQRSTGLKAVFYGYILPFIILMVTLLGTLNATNNEGLAGLFALLVLAPYYFALFMMREKLKSKFEFRIETNT